jgi:hypothetical protein
MARIERRLVCGATISKRGLFLLEGKATISFPLLFCGVATGVAVADFLGWGPFVGAFAFAFVPLEEEEEGFLAVVHRDGFFWGGDSSSLLSAFGLRRDTLGIVRLCARPCVFRRELRPPSQIEE